MLLQSDTFTSAAVFTVEDWELYNHKNVQEQLFAKLSVNEITGK